MATETRLPPLDWENSNCEQWSAWLRESMKSLRHRHPATVTVLEGRVKIQQSEVEERFDRLHETIALRNPPYMTKEELLLVVEVANRYQLRDQAIESAKRNSPKVVRERTAEAFAAKNAPARAIRLLMEKGTAMYDRLFQVGLVTASAIMTAAFPAEFAIIGYPTVTALSKWRPEVAIQFEEDMLGRESFRSHPGYLSALREKAVQLTQVCGERWTPRMIGKVLYAVWYHPFGITYLGPFLRTTS